MTQRFGIDTSILVRLLTGDPEASFAHCVRKLTHLIEGEGAEIFASNQVIGEAYIAVQHHYGVSRADTRAGLIQVLHSGLVTPLNGRSVFAALESQAGCGLLDRLIADDYHRAGLETTLTLDRKMAVLPNTRYL
jgi:predicted nucleic acid-binding protein